MHMGNALNSAACAHKVWIILSLAGSILAFISLVHACEWDYVIWGIRSKSADSLFRFVRNGKAGYIDSTGKIVVNPTLPATSNALGEFS
jgi:hypothetical protein